MSSSTLRPALLGIDLGTSQLKALVTALNAPDAPDAPDALGNQVLGRGRARYPVIVTGDGRAQTDPEDWWRAAGEAVRQALATAAGADVIGMAVAGQMHGVVLSDSAGTPVRPAILWLDRRATAEAAGYRELPSELTGPLGNQPSPGMAGPILRWLASHEPATLAAARWALQPKDWLRLRMTGEAATDPTDASATLLFDLTRGTWSDGLVRVLGLPAAILADVRDPRSAAGRLLPAAAAHLGLRPGVPVAIGAADTAAALFAADPPADAALLALGTGGQWVVPASFLPTASTNLFRAVDGFYRLAASQNVGATLDWVRNLLAVSWQDLYDTAAQPWRADTPRFLPYLAQERWDRSVSGTWAGLTLAHGRSELVRSALEGVAFLLRERLEDLRAAGHDPARVIIGGGGAQHPAWRQLLADVLSLPLYPAPTSWLSATGAIRLAAATTTTATTTAAAPSPPASPEPAAAPVMPSTPPGEVRAAYEHFLALRRAVGNAGAAAGPLSLLLKTKHLGRANGAVTMCRFPGEAALMGS